jgi:hypothetical protein
MMMLMTEASCCLLACFTLPFSLIVLTPNPMIYTATNAAGPISKRGKGEGQGKSFFNQVEPKSCPAEVSSPASSLLNHAIF